jgi:hypothetical protein
VDGAFGGELLGLLAAAVVSTVALVFLLRAEST